VSGFIFVHFATLTEFATMWRFGVFAVALVLCGCQSADYSEPKDISASITDPKLKAEFADQHKQTVAAIKAMRAYCLSKWRGDSGMTAYCEQQQTPKLKSYISRKVTYEHLAKNGLFADDVARYRKCQIAFWGDYESATACVENEKAVAALTRHM
jgi:hypothetical protein